MPDGQDTCEGLIPELERLLGMELSPEHRKQIANLFVASVELAVLRVQLIGSIAQDFYFRQQAVVATRLEAAQAA